MYAVIPGKCKPSKSASTDRTRPILNHGELRQCKDGSWELVTCDSYQLARVPLEVKDPDNAFTPELTAGPITPEALKAAEKAGAFTANGTVDPVTPHGSTTGQSFTRPSTDQLGQFPNWDQLKPEEPFDGDEFTITLDPKLLLSLAQSLGAKKVITLRVDLKPEKDNARPSWQRRPIMCSVDGVDFNGLLMPVRPPGK